MGRNSPPIVGAKGVLNPATISSLVLARKFPGNEGTFFGSNELLDLNQ